MARFAYYEVVTARTTDETVGDGVAGAAGPVLGLPGPTDEPDYGRYAVMLQGRLRLVRECDLVSTGEILRREDIYPGSSIRVSKHGELLPPASDL